jgi:uncharacterized Zn finger protein (UPF0148 family)
MKNCGKCHTCGTKLQIVLDGEEWCPSCEQYKRYNTHGFPVKALETALNSCPELSDYEAMRLYANQEATCEEISRAERNLGA